MEPFFVKIPTRLLIYFCKNERKNIMKTSDKICIVLQVLMVVTALALMVIGLFGSPTKETPKAEQSSHIIIK